MGKQKKHKSELNVAKRGQKPSEKESSVNEGNVRVEAASSEPMPTKDRTQQGSVDATNDYPEKASLDSPDASQNSISEEKTEAISKQEEVVTKKEDAVVEKGDAVAKKEDAVAKKEDTVATKELSSQHSSANTEKRVQNQTQVVSASRITPRKISEGLKQLPPDAYRFVRESYLLLDSDNSGSVSRETLKDMLASLGMRDSGDSRLDLMLERAGQPVTFAGYLTIMGELLVDMSTHDEMDLMLQAFQNKDGEFDQRAMQQALLNEGVSREDIEAVINRFSKPSKYGQVFDTKAFAETMSI